MIIFPAGHWGILGAGQDGGPQTETKSWTDGLSITATFTIADSDEVVLNATATLADTLAQSVLTPAAPTSLTATKDSTFPKQKVDLAWTDNSDNEDGFKVYRRPFGGSFTMVQQLSAGVTSWEDPEAGPPQTAPSPTVDSQDDDAITVDGTFGDGVDYWRVYYIDKGEANWVPGDSDVSSSDALSLPHTISGLTKDDHEYGLRVVPVNDQGEGQWTAEIRQKTGPTEPKNFVATWDGSAWDLTWDIGTRDDDLIRIERNQGAGFVEVDTATAGSTSKDNLAGTSGDTWRIRFDGEATYSNTSP